MARGKAVGTIGKPAETHIRIIPVGASTGRLPHLFVNPLRHPHENLANPNKLCIFAN